MEDENFNPFASKDFVKLFKEGKITKRHNYPSNIDEFDKLIIDDLEELYIKEKNVSITIFEKECLRKFLNQTTKLGFFERLNRLRTIGVPIEIFDKETHAQAIGHNPRVIK